jgi:hypothetical protein
VQKYHAGCLHPVAYTRWVLTGANWCQLRDFVDRRGEKAAEYQLVALADKGLRTTASDTGCNAVHDGSGAGCIVSESRNSSLIGTPHTQDVRLDMPDAGNSYTTLQVTALAREPQVGVKPF